jgi:DNA topoisomerase-1
LRHVSHVKHRARRLAAACDPAASAEAARLRYVTDARPGIRRLRAGRHFRYVAPGGRPVRDPDELRRIRSLAVPPAWTDVWISPDPRGHLQATGRDARRRKQYRYHARWRAVRDDSKYDRLLAFGRALPRVRTVVERHLALRGLPREKVLATIVRLLDSTAIRVGNGEYARENKSFGLTTLRSRHAAVSGATVRFQFRGKGGKLQQADVQDRRVARIIRRCQELPGQELFRYVDAGGRTRTIDSADVNAYLRRVTGQDFTAKDFRTWAGTVLATVALGEQDPKHGRRGVRQAIGVVAERLGNTPTICRKSYVHPGVIDAYGNGALVAALARRRQNGRGAQRPGEACVLALLAA